MIASIHGTVVQKEEQALIVQVSGMGFRVFVPRWLAESAPLHETITLQTYLLVREQELALYGFETNSERKLFEMLLGVSGVGPRLALAILSNLSQDALQRAVFEEQPEILARVPGIGKKMAQKIIFHLKDRLKPTEALAAVASLDAVDEEVLNALIALGYSVVEAQAAVQSIPPDASEDIETRLRLALQYFSQ